MADPVHFATVEDTVTPAQSSGFSGFPAPLITSPGVPDPSLFFPVAMPFTECIEKFWRIKKWAVATDFVQTAGAQVATFLSQTMNGGSTATRENELVLQGQYIACGLPVDVNGTVGDVGAFELFRFPPSPGIYTTGGDLYPAINIGSNLDVDDGINKIRVNLSQDPTGAAGSITATVDGHNVTLYHRPEVQTGDGAYSITFMDFTPVEWWPYAAEDASPIYDTATGAQLQNPRN